MNTISDFIDLLVKEMFNEEERQNRNCMGKRGKLGLDLIKLQTVQNLVYKYYEVPYCNQPSVWRECIVRIDEFLRRKSKARN